MWDTTTSNLVTASTTEDEGLAFVQAYVAQHGRQYALSWVLLWDDDAADLAGQIAEGQSLLARAEVVGAAAGTPPPVTPLLPR